MISNNKINYLLIFLLFLIAIIFRITFYDYGLPYFTNSDEGSLVKSTLYFFNFLSSSSPSQLSSEPIYGTFINFLFSGFILFIKQIFYLDFNFASLPLKIYLEPSIFIKIGRLSSILANSLTIIIFSLIIKKIEIKIIDKILVILLLCFSYSQIEISQIYGKNSYAVLFFLTQVYFILNYIEQEKLKLNQIIILSFLSAIGFGINYISALPSLLFLFLRFLNNDFRKREIKLYFFFSLLFLIFILPVFFLNDYPFYKHFINLDGRELLSPDKNKIEVILKNIKEYFFLILNFEFPLLIIIILAIFNFKKINLNDLGKFKFLLLVSFLTISIFCLADYSKASVRYFSLIVPLLYIICAIIIKNFNPKRIMFLRVLILTMIMLNFTISLSVIYKSNNKQTQYLALNFIKENKIDSKNTIIHFNELSMRESVNCINTNIELLKNGSIKVSTAARGRNTIDKLEIKAGKLKKFPNSKVFEYEGFIMTNGIDVVDHEKFFTTLKLLKYEYFVIDDHKLLRSSKKKEILNYLSNNFKLIKSIKGNNILYRRNITNILDVISLERFGPNILIYKL
jgi:hypothetical protein